MTGERRIRLLPGRAENRLRELPDESVSALVTDPPAGIGFMGKEWDDDRGGRVQWVDWLRGIAEQCLRAMKPGAHGLVWALPRTSHWTATALELAGFEIRDVITHHFGTGFPKSLDVSKAIDDAAGATRSVVGSKLGRPGYALSPNSPKEGEIFGTRIASHTLAQRMKTAQITAAATEDAKRWDGWGTALKPASEHWILIRKPLVGTVAANVLAHETGGLNIDASRIGSDQVGWGGGGRGSDQGTWNSTSTGLASPDARPVEGRWPANLILSHDPDCVLPTDDSLPVVEVGEPDPWDLDDPPARHVVVTAQPVCAETCPVRLMGRESRFFYVAKPTRAERNEGCEQLAPKSGGEATDREDGTDGLKSPRAGAGRTGGARNFHPTVKSIALMRYLCKLVTPPDGLILDPFAGSGSTLIAAHLLGFRAVGIEMSTDYLPIAVARLRHWTAKGRVG